MRASSLIPTALARVRSGGALLPVFIGVLYLLRLVIGAEESGLRLMPILVAACNFLGYLMLSPMPWQWTGDPADKAPPLRGFLQALVWNALWLGLLGLGLQALLGRSFSGAMPLVRLRTAWSFLPRGSVFALVNFPLAMIIGRFMAEWEAARRQRVRISERNLVLEASSRQAHTFALQAQMDPHILYNALSGIAELVHHDADAAETALLDLSDLLRKLTHYGRKLEVPLKEERDLVAQYLAIEALRLGDRLRVVWEWDPETDRILVPPLLLQPLVENAVQHGIARSKVPGTLRIGSRVSAGDLVLQVANEGPDWDPPSTREGVGQGNLRRRLELLEGARIQWTREGAWTLAEIRITQRNPHAA